MDVCSSRRTGSGLVLRNSSKSPRDGNVQTCSRAGCSSKLNQIGSPSNTSISSSSKAKASMKAPFRPPGLGKEIIGSSFKLSVSSRKLISDPNKSKLRFRKSAESESNIRCKNGKYHMSNIRCNSVSDVVSSSSTESPPLGKRRDISRKRICEPVRSLSMYDSSRTRNGSPRTRRSGNQVEPPVRTQLENRLGVQNPSGCFSRPNRSSGQPPRSNSTNHEGAALRRHNLVGIAEMLLALERIEQIEEPSYAGLLVRETSLFLGGRGGVGFHDQHRDMRLDIDNMSYEELLALEERMGSVSTGIAEGDQKLCIKKSRFQDDDDDVKCSICQEEYEDGEEVGRLKCAHGYHVGCIKHWLTLKNWCPICKASASLLPS